eukprot:13658090-Alexandrium_andersonii.AAC.1
MAPSGARVRAPSAADVAPADARHPMPGRVARQDRLHRLRGAIWRARVQSSERRTGMGEW